MDAARWQEVEQVLDVALESDPASWPSILNDRCSGDPELLREVEALLARLGTAQRLLDSPPDALAAALVAEAREAETDRYLGRLIGSYRLVRQLGRGGMSRVYLGERADGQFEQRVAVKLLRPGLDSQFDLERFRRERQILARMNHPAIARLLDGGVTAEGMPYLVMEHVEGGAIDLHCTRLGLNVRRRVELFLAVLEATQYAHSNLILHRDLKPSNIFVTGDGTVKLLDFGLGKLLESEPPTVAERVTGTAQRWMTPEYAAPEQIRGDPVTTSTDVYQLGAVLFELLTGLLPFGQRQRNVHDLESAILGHDPPAPSTVVSGAPLAYAAKTPYARSSPPPDATRKSLRGDIDAIVLRALRKEPDQRHVSAQEFADDLRRWLSGHPVRARRQTRAYRARRFVQRHSAGTAVAVLMVLMAGAYVRTVIVERNRVQQALTEAQLGTRRAEQVTDFMVGLFQAAEGGRALTDTLTARALLSRALLEARALSGQPAMRAQMLDVIGRLHTQLGNYDEARPVLEEALAIRREIYDRDHPDVITSMEHLATALESRGDLLPPVRLRREAFDLRRRVSGAEDPKTVNALFNLAFVAHRSGDSDEAQRLFDEWLTIAPKLRSEPTAVRAAQLASAADLLRLRGEGERAEGLFRDALRMRVLVFGNSHHLVAASLSDIANLLATSSARAGEADSLYVEAIAILRSVYPDGHPRLATTLNRRGVLLARADRLQEALDPLREGLGLDRRFAGDNSIQVAGFSLTLSNVLTRIGSYAEAEALGREALRIYRGQVGEDSPLVFFARAHMADAARGQGRFAEAEPVLLASFERFNDGRPVTAQWRRHAIACLVRLYTAQGRTAEAAKYESLLKAARN